jgi:putative flippase GtrA
MAEIHQQILKFVCVGSVVVVINVGTLYSLTEFLHIYYLLSAVLAFLVAFLASFSLQKFFTFRETSTGRTATRQIALYLVLQLAYLGTNAALLYAFVEYLRVWYVLAEIIIALGLAVVTFTVSRRFIFVHQVSDAL